MVRLRLSNLMLFLVVIFSAIVLIGCSGAGDVSSEDSEENRGEDVNGYKNSQEVVSPRTLESKTSINKDNLEAISSSIAGFISSSDFAANMDKDEVMFKIIEYLNTP